MGLCHTTSQEDDKLDPLQLALSLRLRDGSLVSFYTVVTSDH